MKRFIQYRTGASGCSASGTSMAQVIINRLGNNTVTSMEGSIVVTSSNRYAGISNRTFGNHQHQKSPAPVMNTKH